MEKETIKEEYNENNVSYSQGKKLSEYAAMCGYTEPLQPKKKIGLWFKIIYFLFIGYHTSCFLNLLSNLFAHTWLKLIFLDLCMIGITIFYAIGLFFLAIKFYDAYAYSLFVKNYNVSLFICVIISFIYGNYSNILMYFLIIFAYLVSVGFVSGYLKDRE